MKWFFLAIILAINPALAATKVASSSIAKTIGQFAIEMDNFDDQPDKPRAIINILRSYPWLDPQVFNNEVDKFVLFTTPADLRSDIFARFRPTTDKQKLLLWDANNFIHKKSAIKLPEFWITADLTSEEEAIFINRYERFIDDDLLMKRVNYLSWTQQHRNILHLKSFFSPAARKLLANETGSNKMEADKIATYTYINQLLKSEDYDEASELVLSMDEDSLQHFQAIKWWKIRHILAREQLKNNRYRTAYKLVSSHKSYDAEVISDAEWLSGWISLKFFNDPERAIVHFLNVYQNAKMSDSKAKAAYWLWKSYAASGQDEEADRWLEVSTSYSGFFYGQVAALSSSRKILPFDQINTAEHDDNKAFQNQIRAGVELYKQQNNKWGRRLIISAADQKISVNDAFKAAAIIDKLNDQELNVLFAKKVANNHNINLRQGYPIHLKVNGSTPSLYYAIMRQESNFNSKALSPVGAYGLMQLMPKTASMLSKKLKIPHAGYKRNIAHNVASGAAYLDMLRGELDNGYIAPIASYNAGKHNVLRWMNNKSEFKNLNEAVEWIETIPYGETRFYVKKVIANMVVYDHLLAEKKGKPIAIASLKAYFS
jgi:soluble lytic murein transglycosylase